MGIADRDYIQDSPRGGWRGGGGGTGLGKLNGLSVNTWLIIINVAVFLVFNVVLGNVRTDVTYGRELASDITPAQRDSLRVVLDQAPLPHPDLRGVYYHPIVAPSAENPNTFVQVGRARFVPSQPLTNAWLSFSTWKGFLELQVWRLVTYQFTHANFMHIAMNMIGLWVFGSLVEGHLGRRRYLAFYIACGVAGGLCYLLLNLAGSMGLPLPGSLHVDMITPLVGASASVFGVLMAAAKIAPNSIVQLIFPPIPLKLKWLAYGYVGFAAFNLFIRQGANQGGDAAHIGGAIAGFFLIRNAHLLAGFLDIFSDSTKPKKQRPGPAVRSRKAPKPKPSDEAEIDRLLDKVREHGVQSLTKREEKALREATERRRV